MNAHESLQILDNDALSGLRSLPDDSAQVALTSPPFYLLRRYGGSVPVPLGDDRL
jgi:site-specific DNA-methyltransferase (cytosine-N4-specific)